MKEQIKCDEVRDYLYISVFIEALEYAKKYNDEVINTFVYGTIEEMYRITSPKRLIEYYKNIIRCGTPKLKRISKYMKDRNITRLEDIETEFNKKFNNKWLNK